MSRQTGIRAALATLILITTPAMADSLEADSIATDPLVTDSLVTVDQWIEEALANNATLGALQSAIEAAQADVEGAGTWADPVVKYGIAPETLEGSNTVGHRFEVSQKLPWPDQLSADRQASEAGVVAARQNRLWEKRKLTASIKETYARWWYLNRAIKLHHETRSLVEQLVEITRQRLEYGKGSQSALLRLETELDSLDAQLVDLQGEQKRLSASLIPLLGRQPKPTRLELPMPVRLPTMPDNPAPVDHPLVQAAQARTAEARARLDAAEANRRPRFTASVGYNSLWADDRKRWVVGVGVQVPLSGQRQNSAVRKAAAKVSEHQWQATQTQRDLLASIADTEAHIEASNLRLDILEERRLPNQRAHWQAILNELSSGTGRLEDAIDSARQLTGTELEKAAVIRDLFSARARYEALLSMQTNPIPN